MAIRTRFGSEVHIIDDAAKLDGSIAVERRDDGKHFYVVPGELKGDTEADCQAICDAFERATTPLPKATH